MIWFGYLEMTVTFLISLSNFRRIAENGNPEPIFDYSQIGIFAVTVMATFEEEHKKQSNKPENNREKTENTRENTREKTREKILSLIKEDKNITTKILAKKIGVSSKSIEYHIDNLKKEEILKRMGSKKYGYWEVKFRE